MHGLYKERAESENWIEQTENQLHASQTLTDDFSANDILWQLAVLSYNLSACWKTPKTPLETLLSQNRMEELCENAKLWLWNTLKAVEKPLDNLHFEAKVETHFSKIHRCEAKE